MIKIFVLALIIALANAQWREGVADSRCPNPNGDFPTFLPGNTCTTFFKCNDGYRCEFMRFRTTSHYFSLRSTDPFDCPEGNHWNAAKNTCDLPEDAGCQ
jgi:Chitin binding Peritrophin-A domain